MPNKAKPDWRGLVSGLTDTQKLIHLAMRHDKQSTEEIRAELVKARQRIYNDEISIQARRAGCTRTGNLTGGAILKELNQQSKTDAVSISNTYNYDLAVAISQIAADNPRANRTVYASRLRAWETERAGWKAQQIAQWTETTARAKAQQDFYQNNKLDGLAELSPKTAVCPVCQGWISRGLIPIRVAQNNPPPYHLRCPHYFINRPEKVERRDCEELWTG